MAVRVTFLDGETVFAHATSAVWRGTSLVVFAWNADAKTLDEVAVFAKGDVISFEIMKRAQYRETIKRYKSDRLAKLTATASPERGQ